MDFFRHFSPREGARWNVLSFSTPPVTKTHESATTLFIRTMRLTGVILLAFCLQVSARSNAQQRIAINVKNVSLQKLFAEIEKKTSYTFFYDVTILKETKLVSLQFKDATVEEILKQALVGQSLEYTITDKTIFVKKERKPAVQTAPADTGRGATNRVKGVVLTDAGVPVQGANVTIKLIEKGTITDAKGEFELSAVPLGGVLVFSYVGYAPQSFTIRDGSQVRVYMKVAQNELDKAVVQAYGTTTQRLTTADIGKVTAEEIERQPVMNPLLSLQGKVAGLDVVETSGYASAPVKVELRGRASIGLPGQTFPSDPLYIVDGVPLTTNEVSGLSSYTNGSVGYAQVILGPAKGQSPFFSINPADIESIEVLKDADATAIYGSRGANGVILITTKKGKAGKTKFDLGLNEGINRVDRYWNMMNTSQYLAMRRQAFYNTGTAPSPLTDFDVNGTWDTTKYTNWQKALYGGMGKNTNIQASLSGGDARTTFRISAGYNRTTGITTISGADQRGSLALNLTHRSLDQRLSIGLSGQFSYTQSNLISLPGNVLMAPDAPPIYDSLGNLNWTGWAGKNQNPTAERAFPFGSIKQSYIAKTNFLNSNLLVGYEIIRGLQASISFGYGLGQQNQVNTLPIASQNPLTSPVGNLFLGNNRNINWIVEPQITYNAQIGKGKLSMLVGASSSQNNTESLFVGGGDYLSDLLINNISSAGSLSSMDLYGEYRYFGVYGRVSYNWENKYVLNLNVRRDGSSRFGANEQFGDFASIGGAWIVSEEHWFKSILIGTISFLKLRGSYGTTGSDAVPNYSYLSQYSSNANGVLPYDNQTALVPLIDPNPDFRWQSNRKLEGAINLGLLKDRINIQVAWYRDRCGNQLVSFPTPFFTGFSSVIENSPALVQNMGWEFTFSANLMKTKKFSWSLDFNTAINSNKLVAYPDFAQSPYTQTLKIGQPLNMQYALHYIGVDPQTGQYSFLDKNHDGKITYDPGKPDDDSYIVNLTPKFFGGLGMNFAYVGLNLNLFFNIKDQIGKNAYSNFGLPPGNVNINEPAEIIGKQWQFPGDNTASLEKFTASPGGVSHGFFLASDGVYTDASFIRLSNLSISYNLPTQFLKKAGLQGCNVFVHTNNLFVFTKYKGLDPETQNFGGLPPTKTIVGGITFNF
jgi:TonB-linked SusC/RagA family outer membrane protein